MGVVCGAEQGSIRWVSQVGMYSEGQQRLHRGPTPGSWASLFWRRSSPPCQRWPPLCRHLGQRSTHALHLFSGSCYYCAGLPTNYPSPILANHSKCRLHLVWRDMVGMQRAKQRAVQLTHHCRRPACKCTPVHAPRSGCTPPLLCPPLPGTWTCMARLSSWKESRRDDIPEGPSRRKHA